MKLKDGAGVGGVSERDMSPSHGEHQQSHVCIFERLPVWETACASSHRIKYKMNEEEGSIICIAFSS